MGFGNSPERPEGRLVRSTDHDTTYTSQQESLVVPAIGNLAAAPGSHGLDPGVFRVPCGVGCPAGSDRLVVPCGVSGALRGQTD